MLSLFSFFFSCLYPYYGHTGLASSCGSWEFSRHKFSFFHRYTHTQTKIDLPIRNVVLVAAQRTPAAPITIIINHQQFFDSFDGNNFKMIYILCE